MPVVLDGFKPFKIFNIFSQFSKNSKSKFLNLMSYLVCVFVYSRISCLKRALRFERKMKSEIKLNSEHLFEFATHETNALW